MFILWELLRKGNSGERRKAPQSKLGNEDRNHKKGYKLFCKWSNFKTDSLSSIMT